MSWPTTTASTPAWACSAAGPLALRTRGRGERPQAHREVGPPTRPARRCCCPLRLATPISRPAAARGAEPSGESIRNGARRVSRQTPGRGPRSAGWARPRVVRLGRQHGNDRLDGVHSAWARWALGMCSATVDGCPSQRPRWDVTRRPSRKTSTVAAVQRTSTCLAEELKGHAVGVALDQDVAVDVDAAPLPLGECSADKRVDASEAPAGWSRTAQRGCGSRAASRPVAVRAVPDVGRKATSGNAFVRRHTRDGGKS